jgi:hypothetical protein
MGAEKEVGTGRRKEVSASVVILKEVADPVESGRTP